MEENKPGMPFSSKLVLVSATAIFIYTAVMIFLAIYNIQNKTNTWPPSELTALWFAFWTVELVSLATIKVSKVRNKYEKEETVTTETTLQPNANGEMVEVTKTIKEIR